MKTFVKTVATTVLIFGYLLSFNASAANGSLVTGNSPNSLGTGGTAIAMPQDSFAADDNPAGMAYVGTRVDVYGALLNGKTDATFGPSNNHLKSDLTVPFPGFAANYDIDQKWTIGVSTQSVGAGVDYGEPLLNIPGLKKASTSFVQVNTLTTLTYKPTPSLALGASTIIGVQKFRADGVFAIAPDGTPAPLPSHGSKYSWGTGYALGVLWSPVPLVSVGASYYSKMHFSDMDGYKEDLLASTGGAIDIPPRYGVGVAVHPTEALTLGLDYMSVLWSESKTLGDENSFGWHDQHVIRAGAIYKINDQWTARVGVSRANDFSDSDHTNITLYVPGIANRSVTAGASYSLNASDTITASYEYAFSNSNTGTGANAGSKLTARMQMLMVGYEKKF